VLNRRTLNRVLSRRLAGNPALSAKTKLEEAEMLPFLF